MSSCENAKPTVGCLWSQLTVIILDKLVTFPKLGCVSELQLEPNADCHNRCIAVIKSFHL